MLYFNLIFTKIDKFIKKTKKGGKNTKLFMRS